MPAPTQTLAMMQAPPMTDGVDVMCVTPNLSQSSEKGTEKSVPLTRYASINFFCVLPADGSLCSTSFSLAVKWRSTAGS
jgi:hypothetical protein